MAGQHPLSYSAALSQGTSSTQSTKDSPTIQAEDPPPTSKPDHAERSRRGALQRRSPSPSHIPQTGSTEENVYILTLQTDKAHHARMTLLRDKYFPKKLNKLEAHLTLFHALPESRLESDIIPALNKAANTPHFPILADKLYRMKHGVAISLSEEVGGAQAKSLHTLLKSLWKREGFLSPQDAGGARLHYTLMNKADEKDADRAFTELNDSWTPDEGIAVGLGLWRYDKGFWRWERGFGFRITSLETQDSNDGKQ